MVVSPVLPVVFRWIGDAKARDPDRRDMQIAVAGKGGAGKTIVAGTLARWFGANGDDVVAIDDHDNPNLAVSLGLAHDRDVPPLPGDLLSPVESDDDQDWELTRPPRDIIDEHGVRAPDGVTLLRAGEVTAEAGGFEYSHFTVLHLLSELEPDNDEVIVLDMAAGLAAPYMALTVDVLLLVVNPNGISLETATTLRGFAAAFEVEDVRVVANNVRTDRDRDRIEEYCGEHGLDVSAIIPNDDAIREVELAGTAPTDYDGDSPAVRAIRDLATDLDGINYS